jgi:hypothetical protein
MTEETFFTVLRDHVPHYVVTVTYNIKSPLMPYAVELFYRSTTYRSVGSDLSMCFQNLFQTLGISTMPAPETSFQLQAGQARFGKK